MDISTLIPQLFYDVIGRIIPGATLLATTLILFEGPSKGLRHLATWSNNPSETNIPTVLIVMGNLLASHILASLLGGLWFRAYRIRCHRELRGFAKYINGWGKRGEDRMKERLNNAFNEEYPEPSDKCKNDSSTDRIAYMYDYVLLNCPKAGARIAKLRAEQHMSGVLMIGFFALVLFCWFFPYIQQSGLMYWIVAELLLSSAVISAGALAWHLEKRCGAALFNLWLLASSGIGEK